MNILLDTPVLIRALSEPDLLRADAAAAIEDPGNTVVVSAVSAFEIAVLPA